MNEELEKSQRAFLREFMKEGIIESFVKMPNKENDWLITFSVAPQQQRKLKDNHKLL